MVRGRGVWPLALVAALAALVAAAFTVLGGVGHSGAPAQTTAGTATAASASPGAGGCGAAGSGVCTPVELVIIGLRGCPHCRAMEEWLPSLGYPVAFCDIRESLVCSDVFTELYNRGLAKGVPVIGACSGDRLLFVEVGELRNQSWWLRALRGSTSGVGGVPVYWGTRLVTVVTGSDAEELSRAICGRALGAAKPVAGAG